MQTFLPYPDFEQSARALDPKRLGKQRVETIQVVRALTRPDYGWQNHPAVLMWRGHEEALGRYGFVCCEVWCELGFGDTCAQTIAQDLRASGVARVRTQDELAAAGAAPVAGRRGAAPQPPVGAAAQGPRVLRAAVRRRAGRPAVRVAGQVGGRGRGRATPRRECRPASAASAREARRGGGATATPSQPGGQEGVADATRQRGEAVGSRRVADVTRVVERRPAGRPWGPPLWSGRHPVR